MIAQICRLYLLLLRYFYSGMVRGDRLLHLMELLSIVIIISDLRARI